MFWGSRYLLKVLRDINKGMSTNPDVSWPKFKYLEGEISGNLTKTRTMGVDDAGIIHSLGYKSDMHIKTDIAAGTIEKQAEGLKGFIGTVEASDGNTYYMPAYSSSIGILNKKTGEITTVKKFNMTPQVRSGAEGANGIIYMPSYTSTLKIYTYDTKTGEVDSFTPTKKGSHGHIWGAAADKKGEVYMPPALNNYVAKIDKNGEFKYLDGPRVTSGVSGFNVKYVGATYVESLDKVFCLPRKGKKILIINCVDDTYEEIDLPAEYLKVSNVNRNFHGYLAPDGWLYSAFWADTYCFRINPETYEIQWKSYEKEFENCGIQNRGTGYSTAAITIGDEVYLGLAGTTKAVKLEFEKQLVISNEDVSPSSSATICGSCPSSSATICGSCPSPTPTATTCGSCPSPSSSATTCGSCPSPSSSATICGSCPSSSATICGSYSCCNTCC